MKTQPLGLFGVVLALSVLGTTGASAQSAVGGVDLSSVDRSEMFSRDRNVSVRERPRPGYEAVGARVGGFMFYPKVTAEVERNDNIYAVTTRATQDNIWHVRPEATLQSNWTRHALDAYAAASTNRYQDNSSEDTTDWKVGANGRLDITYRANLKAGAELARLTEPRSSSGTPTNAAEPVQYKQDQAYLVGAQSFNRLKLSARADWRKFDYENVRAIGGGTISQNDRDRTAVDTTARADYAISPDTAVFVEVSGNRRDYRLAGTKASPARDSSGYSALVGANFDISKLIRGEIGVGYLSQSFKSSTFRDTSGLGVRAKVEWFPTQLTTLTGIVTRSIEDSTLANSGGYLSTNVGVQVDHELLRNVILTGKATYGKDDYKGVSREDERTSAGASATYLLNRRVGLNLAYSYSKQDSSGAFAGASFKINRVTAGLVWQF